MGDFYRPGHHWQRDDPTPFAELPEEAQVVWDRDIPDDWHGRPVSFYVGELIPAVHHAARMYTWWIVAWMELDDHSTFSFRYDAGTAKWTSALRSSNCVEYFRKKYPCTWWGGVHCQLKGDKIE